MTLYKTGVRNTNERNMPVETFGWIEWHITERMPTHLEAEWSSFEWHFALVKLYLLMARKGQLMLNILTCGWAIHNQCSEWDSPWFCHACLMDLVELAFIPRCGFLPPQGLFHMFWRISPRLGLKDKVTLGERNKGELIKHNQASCRIPKLRTSGVLSRYIKAAHLEFTGEWILD